MTRGCRGYNEIQKRRSQRDATPAWMPTRRGVLVGAGLGLLSWATKGSALADVTLSPQKNRDVLVFIFLRGGADGLNMVVPYAEDAYYRSRPSLSIPKSKLHDLDGFFGFHPALSTLLPLYREGQLALFHALGSQDQTRSHFEAMSAMERGLASDGAGPASGWIARHLLATESDDDSPLRAIAFGDTMPDALRGATTAVALNSLAEFRLDGSDETFKTELRRMYQSGKDEVSHAGRQTLSVLDSLNRIDPKGYAPRNNAVYPDSDLGRGLKEVACLLRAELGLEVACLDKGGWDTHVAQGADTGWQASLLEDLGRSIAAFGADLGQDMSRVTLVAMTEFGRRVAENAGLGTDHGRASVAFVMGAGFEGGQVHAKWPGMEPDQLDEIGDLRVTTDYRQVLSSILVEALGNRSIEQVFPKFAFTTA